MVLTAASTTPGVLQDRLDLLTIQINTLLSSLAGEHLLDARRAITRDLRFEPRAEELQTIVKIASDESLAGPRHELPRRFLSVRILSERTVKLVQESKTVDTTGTADAAAMLDGLLGETQRLEGDLERAVSDPMLDHDDRDYLLRVGEALSYPPDTLLANSVLAHRLVELAESMERGDLESAEPGLTPREREQLAEFAAENITPESCRVGLDGIAMRTHVTRLLTAWGELGSPSEDDAARRTQRVSLHERMSHALIALEAVAGRIQVQQDNALVANVESLAAELREASRGLFSIKLHLSPIVRAPNEDHDPAVESDALESGLREQLRQSVTADQEAAGRSPVETEEEIYVKALKGLGDGREIQQLESSKKRKIIDAQRERFRKIILGSVIGLLAITSAIVNFVILPRNGEALAKPDVRELKHVISAQRVETAGPMMITPVDGWHQLDDEERMSRVSDLGGLIAEEGFQLMIIVDEYGDPAAAWDHKTGTGLMEQP